MTHLPKGQLIGIHNPDTIYPVTIGTTPFGYTDLGVVSAGNINVIINLGNGISLAGTSDNHIFRSTDYGNTWLDEGAVSASAVNTFSYIGNGIVIFGNSGAQIRRSTDFGITWSAALFTSGAAVFSSAYLGGGVVLAGTGTFGAPARGHIIQSADYGATWADVAAGGITVGGTDAGFIDSITFIDSFGGFPTVIFTDSNGRVFRSTSAGTTWTVVTDVSVGIALLVSIYIGNDIVIAVNNNGIIFRSNNKGVTWIAATLSAAPVTAPTAIIYLGSGIVAHGGFDVLLNGSYDFGLTWANFALVAGAGVTVTALSYLGNGVVVAGGSNGHIFISDITYKANEAQVNYPRIISGDLGPLGTNTRLIDTVVPGTNIYTNLDKTRTLIVSVGCTCITPAALDGAAFDIEADSAATPITLVSPTVGISTGLLGEQNLFMATGYVGPGLNYRVNQLIAGTGVVTLDKWFEMYI